MDKFKLAYEIVSDIISDDDINYPVFYLGCYCLLDKFGEFYKPLIRKIFADTEFHVDSRNLDSLMAEYGLNSNQIGGDNLKAFSLSGVTFSVDHNGQFELYRDAPKIFCSTSGDANLVLIGFVHEVTHILKSLVNNIGMSDDGRRIIVRSGLFLDMYDSYDGETHNEVFNFMLDEAINVLQTADMMKAVKGIDKRKLPDNVVGFFEQLNLELLDVPYGYEYQVGLVKQLWECERFRECIEDNSITGEIEQISETFDSHFELPTFSQMSDALDYLSSSQVRLEEKIEMESFIQNIVSTYCLKNGKVDNNDKVIG